MNQVSNKNDPFGLTSLEEPTNSQELRLMINLVEVSWLVWSYFMLTWNESRFCCSPFLLLSSFDEGTMHSVDEMADCKLQQ